MKKSFESTRLYATTDPIAERIRKVGGTALRSPRWQKRHD
jgi:DNA-binding ferritin-like protein